MSRISRYLLKLMTDNSTRKWPPIVPKALYASCDFRGKASPNIAANHWLNNRIPSLRGKVVVLELWNTWCHKCTKLVKTMNEITQEFGEDEVVVLGITFESTEKVTAYAAHHNITYYIGVDFESKLFDSLGCSGVPYILVIGPDNIVRWQGVFDEADETDPFNKTLMRNIVQTAFAKKQPELIPLTETITFSAQPSVEQLKHLSLIGIKSVLNLRCQDEKGVIAEEEEYLKADGSSYKQVPIRELKDIDEMSLKEIFSALDQAPKPCLVHCKVGLTAAAAALLYVSKDESPELLQFLGWGGDLGFNFANEPTFFAFLKDRLKS